MAGLPRPELSPGPHRDLVDALHDLHHRAGWPSLRTLAKSAGCSHTTVSTAFSSPRLPAWGLLEVLVEAMDGDTSEFHKLWLAASETQPGTSAPVGLAGRRTELSTLLSHLGSGSGLLLVAGEAGIGKSRLVSTAARVATGVHTVAVNCLPLTSDVPMLPVAQALRTVASEHAGDWMREALAGAPAYVPASLGRLLPEVEADGNREDAMDEWARPRLFLAVGATMKALRDVRPWALVVEDLHWADTATLDVLEHVVSHGTAVPIVGTWRLDDPDVAPKAMEWWTRVLRLRSVDVVELAPFTRAETAAQLELLTGAPLEAGDVDRIHDRSQGLPLFTEQLATHGQASTRLPRLLSDLLDQRLVGLSPNASMVVAILGAADRALDSAALETASGLGEADFRAAVRELADRHLLTPEAGDQLGLKHPLLAEASRRRLVGPESSDVHRRLARTLADAGGSAAEVAEHWRLAGDAREELPWRVAAALDAANVFARATEWEHWRRVFDLWTDDAAASGPTPKVTRPEAVIQGYDAAVDCRDLDGEVQMAERLLSIARDTDTPRELRAAALSRAGEHLGQRGQAQEGLALIEEAVAIHRDLPPSTDQVDALDNQALTLLSLSQPQAAMELVREAVEIAARVPDRQKWRHAVSFLAWHEGVCGHHEVARALTAQALAGEHAGVDPFRELTIGTWLTDLLLIQHAPPYDFDRVGRPAFEAAERWGITYAAPILRTNLSLGYLAAGLVARAAAVLGRLPHDVVAGDAHRHAVQVSIDVARGRFDEAARRYGLLPSFDDPLVALNAVATGAHLELWRGEPADACARLETSLIEVLRSEMSALCGAHLVLLARVTSDQAAVRGNDRDTREEAAAVLRARREEGVVDPLGDQLTPEARTALRRSWNAELARLQGLETTETWAAAAGAWDPMVRPHDAAYCRWRAARVALNAGEGTIAGRLLSRAARDAQEHRPLAASIDATARTLRGRGGS